MLLLFNSLARTNREAKFDVTEEEKYHLFPGSGSENL